MVMSGLLLFAVAWALWIILIKTSSKKATVGRGSMKNKHTHIAAVLKGKLSPSACWFATCHGTKFRVIACSVYVCAGIIVAYCCVSAKTYTNMQKMTHVGTENGLLPLPSSVPNGVIPMNGRGLGWCFFCENRLECWESDAPSTYLTSF